MQSTARVKKNENRGSCLRGLLSGEKEQQGGEEWGPVGEITKSKMGVKKNDIRGGIA